MSVSVTMPRLGESVSEGTVTRWLKKEGERVEADEPLLEVSTDKVDTEIPAPAGGVVVAIRVQEDMTVDVGAELAVIDEIGAGAKPAAEAGATAPPTPAPVAEPQPPAAAGAAEGRAPVPAAEVAEEAAQPFPDEGPRQPPFGEAPAGPRPGSAQGDGHAPAYVTPLVRKLASERGVDLTRLRGTGVGGRIRKQDVLDATRSGSPTNAAPAASPADAAPGRTPEAPPGRAAPTAPPTTPPAAAPTGQPAPAAAATAEPAPAAGLSPIPGHTERMSRLRGLIARRMVGSLQASAQLTTVVEADVTGIARLRERAQEAFAARVGVRLSYLPFFAIAVVEALKSHPMLNSSVDLDTGTITYHDEVRLGIAVDTPRGLLAPVIHNAGDLNLAGMARRIADLAERTRGNAVTPDELGGGTFTLTNTGSRGALFDTPIINQPQVGILGTGAVVKRPTVVDSPEYGEIVAVRSMLYLALTYDHRVVDGADAARFLAAVKKPLEVAAFAPDVGL
ncbi:MAG: 2-oxo acid dehydrogenase subunit E2 [Frankiaceae bacterium]